MFADGVGKALNLSPAAVQNRQDNGMFLHEATHLLHNAKGIPGWVVEGVADWTRDFMLHDREPKKPEPTNDFKDGYSTSAFFFDWLEKSYGKPFVRNIVVTSNKAAMTSFFFFEQTGKQLPTLWEEMTGRHTPVGLLKFTAMAPKCVDGGGPVAESGHAKVATCNAAAATQAWSWGYHNPSANDGLIWLEAMGGGCLDVKDKSKEMGALVRAWPCGKHEGQRWKLLPNGSLLNPNSGYCLDNPNSSTVDGTSLRTWDCNGSPAQRFTLPQ